MSGCPPLEEIGQIDAWRADDPRRRHVENCARCQARLLAYRDFVTESLPPVGARLADARATLDSAIARERAARAAVAAPRAARPVAARRRLLTARPRLLWALAPAVLVVALLCLMPGRFARPLLFPERATGVLRGGAPHDAFRLEPPRVLGDGALELRWHAVPGARGYRVRFFSEGLRPLATTAAQADTVLIVRRAGLPAGLSEGEPFIWRAIALLPAGELLSAPAMARAPR